MTQKPPVYKRIGRIFLALLAFFLAFTLVLFVVHRILLAREHKLLEENGYLNLVSAGDYDLNVCIYGAEEPKHTIVGISGLGMMNTSLAFRDITDRFAGENRIVFPDRAGYGVSDDTGIPQTTERIVQDYRTALQNAGIQAPYLLMAHSIGGVYATYWESLYPEEIEGILYLDASPLTDCEETFEGGLGYDPVTNTLGYALFRMGYQRLVYKLIDPIAFKFAVPETLALEKALTYQNLMSNAGNSETKLANENCRMAYESIVKNDIPKCYIAAGAPANAEEYIAYSQFLYEQMKLDGMDVTEPVLTEEAIAAQLDLVREFMETGAYAFAEDIGNCTVERIPAATHMVYCDRPAECADILQTLIDRIESLYS